MVCIIADWIKYYYFIIYYKPHMKYLAAYALLTLSGKNNISISYPIQLPMTLKRSSPVSNPIPLTINSTELLRPWKESNFINWLLREARELDQVDQLLLLHQRQLRRSKLLKNNNQRRRRSLKRSKNLKLSRLMRIWEICSADFIELFHSH